MVPTHQPSPSPQVGLEGLLQCAAPSGLGDTSDHLPGTEREPVAGNSLLQGGEGCIPGMSVASASRDPLSRQHLLDG